MTYTPPNRRRTFASTFFFRSAKTDFEVYRDPVLPVNHKRSLSERKTRTDIPVQKPALTTSLEKDRPPQIIRPALTTSFEKENEKRLKKIQERIKHVQFEIAYYRSKRQFKIELKNALQAMDLKYKRLTDIDLDLGLLIDKISVNKELSNGNSS